MKLKRNNGGILKVLLIILLILALMAGLLFFLLKRNLKKIEYLDPETQKILSPEELEALLKKETASAASETAGSPTAESEKPETVGKTAAVSGWKPLGRHLAEGRYRGLGVILTEERAGSRSLPLFMGAFLLPQMENGRPAFLQLNEQLLLPLGEGYGENRLGLSYCIGGLPYLYGSLEDYFGLQLQGSIVVGMDRLPEIIDLLGGVTLELNTEQAAAVGRKSGTWPLSGGEAMLLVNNGPDRAADSEAVRLAALQSLARVKPGDLPGLVSTLLTMLATDMDEKTLLEACGTLLSHVSAAGKNDEEIRRLTVPEYGTWDVLPDDTPVLLADQDQCITRLEGFLTEE